MRLLKWLYPGLRVKRWLLISFIGIIFIGFGAAVASGHWFLLRFELALRQVIFTWTGLDLPLLGGAFFVILGIVLTIIGFQQVFKTLMKSLLPSAEGELVDVLYQHRLLKKGPRIVVLGGGTGLSVLLRGLKQYTSNLTAIVTVTDDGGSSGRLRTELGVLPPGDIRNCLVALADKETLMDEVFGYRFKQGQGLAGHTLGNLLLVATSEMAGGFVQSIQEVSKILAVRGQVLPATLSQEALCAELLDGEIAEGETEITRRGAAGIRRVFLRPGNPRPVDESLAAIEKAEAIILGPGSLYTSVIPNLLVEGVVEALRKSKGIKIYICNVMTQPGETDHFTASDHLRVLYEHCGENFIDYIIVNGETAKSNKLQKYEFKGAYPVPIDQRNLAGLGVKVIRGDLLDESDMVRHDPHRLAEAVIKLVLRNRLLKKE